MAQTRDLGVAAPVADRAQTYAAILVHAEPGGAATHRVETAARLAREFGARLIGLGAETFETVAAVDPWGGAVVAEWIVAAQKQLSEDLKEAEAAFRRDAAGADVEWRASQDFPDRALARAARAADLIVASPKRAASESRAADPADVIMSAGRPVLIVPADRHLHTKTVVIAWKDTREARRAVADAMPFLLRAEDVIVQAICETEHLEAACFQAEDVVQMLKRRGVSARANVTRAASGDVGQELQRISDLNGQALIVAGAYGHSRLTEWVFGGVTDELLRRPRSCVLLSH